MKPSVKKLIKIMIVGAGGFGREVLWTLHDCNKKSKKYEILGFIDDNKSLWKKHVNNFPVMGGIDWFLTKNPKDVHCIVAIGDTRIRQNVVKKLEEGNTIFETIVHPSVIFSDSVEIGKGTIIQAGSILTVNIKIGKHTHINIDSTVGHDSIIDDFVTINPGVHVNGNILIETGAFIGSGTAMKEKIRIGKWAIVGAGTALISDVPENSLYVGVPGKLKKKLKPL